jgi:REP element-mobilizing transposase RayT
MPRVARIVLPGLPHHITQRGNNRQDVFFADSDRARYLEILSKQSSLYGLTVEAYCLMTNHIHIIATPSQEASRASTGIGFIPQQTRDETEPAITPLARGAPQKRIYKWVTVPYFLQHLL